MKNSKSKLEKLTNKLKSIKARDIMTKDVITTTEDATLADVAKTVIEKRISGMPVLNKKRKVVGIITTADLFIVMDMIQTGDVIEEGRASSFNPTVKFAMSTDIVKINKNTNLEEIITMVKYRNLHTIPVFEAGKMVGVVGRRDIFKNFYHVVKELI